MGKKKKTEMKKLYMYAEICNEPNLIAHFIFFIDKQAISRQSEQDEYNKKKTTETNSKWTTIYKCENCKSKFWKFTVPFDFLLFWHAHIHTHRNLKDNKSTIAIDFL